LSPLFPHSSVEQIENTNTMNRILLFALTATLLLCIVSKHHYIDAYPILIEVPGNKGHNKVCVTLEIPDDDDVHMVISNLPQDVDAQVETWVMTEMSAITNHESEKFLKMYSNPPPEVNSYIKEASTYRDVLYVTITGPLGAVRTHHVSPYKIMVLKNVADEVGGYGKNGRMGPDDDDWSPERGMHEICVTLENNSVHDNSASHFAFEYLLISEFEEKLRNKHILKKEHLTPIENHFEQSIVSAKSIINEMMMLEKRESRMRHTSDSVLKRIRYFSYVSIAILLGVTWLQITYLKGYFKKKKVL